MITNSRDGSIVEMKARGMTYDAIAKIMGVTRQRVQQILRPGPLVLFAIKQRARGRCEKCSKPISTGHIHHIRYGIEESNPKNFLYLCPSCHCKETQIRPLSLRVNITKHQTINFASLKVNGISPNSNMILYLSLCAIMADRFSVVEIKRIIKIVTNKLNKDFRKSQGR